LPVRRSPERTQRGIVARFFAASAALGGVILALVAIALVYRAGQQHGLARSLASTSANGIHAALFVRIGGIDQAIQIRGEHRENPVILILHGGPGISMMALTPVFQSWEKYFTVVQWDQRGAGKTYGRNGGAAERPQMNISRMSADGLEVAAYVRAYLHKDRIIVLGHSWGTVLALRMIVQRPAWFIAYVGTGQLVDKVMNEDVAYHQLLARVRDAGDGEGERALQKIGAPPYRELSALIAERKWVTKYDTPAERTLESRLTPMVLFAPNYSPADILDFLHGIAFSQAATYAENNIYDARSLGLRFEIPFFIFQGDEDHQTPTILVEQYFATVEAPIKRFELLKGGGHSAMLTMPDVFLNNLLKDVLPLTVGH
jgi:pimeloyl-ACP methyl ester carboxylesterase